MKSTADILDAQPVEARVCELSFKQYGGVPSFGGPVSTVRCHENNVVLKRHLGEPGEGRVLVVDGGGSLHVALLGDRARCSTATTTTTASSSSTWPESGNAPWDTIQTV